MTLFVLVGAVLQETARAALQRSKTTIHVRRHVNNNLVKITCSLFAPLTSGGTEH